MSWSHCLNMPSASPKPTTPPRGVPSNAYWSDYWQTYFADAEAEAEFTARQEYEAMLDETEPEVIEEDIRPRRRRDRD